MISVLFDCSSLVLAVVDASESISCDETFTCVFTVTTQSSQCLYHLQVQERFKVYSWGTTAYSLRFNGNIICVVLSGGLWIL